MWIEDFDAARERVLRLLERTDAPPTGALTEVLALTVVKREQMLEKIATFLGAYGGLTSEPEVRAILAAKASLEGTPPTATPEVGPDEAARLEMERRRARISEIYVLGRSDHSDDRAIIKAMIVGDGTVWERASAIRSLSRERLGDLVADLKRLTGDKNTAVRIEAAIRLYQWGDQAFALPVLKSLRGEGIALRRAFQTGFEDGKPTYDPNALGFFRQSVKSENVYVQLDAAVGLMELGKEAEGAPVIQGVLQTEAKYHIRMAAVNYLTPLKANGAAKRLIQLAARDKDERVAARARQVLAQGE